MAEGCNIKGGEKSDGMVDVELKKIVVDTKKSGSIIDGLKKRKDYYFKLITLIACGSFLTMCIIFGCFVLNESLPLSIYSLNLNKNIDSTSLEHTQTIAKQKDIDKSHDIISDSRKYYYRTKRNIYYNPDNMNQYYKISPFIQKFLSDSQGQRDLRYLVQNDVPPYEYYPNNNYNPYYRQEEDYEQQNVPIYQISEINPIDATGQFQQAPTGNYIPYLNQWQPVPYNSEEEPLLSRSLSDDKDFHSNKDLPSYNNAFLFVPETTKDNAYDENSRLVTASEDIAKNNFYENGISTQPPVTQFRNTETKSALLNSFSSSENNEKEQENTQSTSNNNNIYTTPTYNKENIFSSSEDQVRETNKLSHFNKQLPGNQLGNTEKPLKVSEDMQQTVNNNSINSIIYKDIKQDSTEFHINNPQVQSTTMLTNSSSLNNHVLNDTNQEPKNTLLGPVATDNDKHDNNQEEKGYTLLTTISNLPLNPLDNLSTQASDFNQNPTTSSTQIDVSTLDTANNLINDSKEKLISSFPNIEQRFKVTSIEETSKDTYQVAKFNLGSSSTIFRNDKESSTNDPHFDVTEKLKLEETSKTNLIENIAKNHQLNSGVENEKTEAYNDPSHAITLSMQVNDFYKTTTLPSTEQILGKNSIKENDLNNDTDFFNNSDHTQNSTSDLIKNDGYLNPSTLNTVLIKEEPVSTPKQVLITSFDELEDLPTSRSDSFHSVLTKPEANDISNGNIHETFNPCTTFTNGIGIEIVQGLQSSSDILKPYPFYNKREYYKCFPSKLPQRNLIEKVFVEPVLQKPLETLYKNNISRSIENCPVEQTSCQDGSKCISSEQFCDGNVHCRDASDEEFCSCTKRISKIRLCDGYFDCPNGEDEKECFGCSPDMFSCDDWTHKRRIATCIPNEQRCDGIEQCPTGKDEHDCSTLVETISHQQTFEISKGVGFLYRNYRGQWYLACLNHEVWAAEVCENDIGPSALSPLTNWVKLQGHYNGRFLNEVPTELPQIVNTCQGGAAVFVECPQIVCGTCMKLNNPYRSEEMDTSAERVLATFEESPMDENEFVNSNSRVVGGKPSQPESWPWIVAIYRNGLFHCGAVIINDRWVITAAHCVDRYWLYYFEVQAGIIRRYSYSPTEQNRRVSRIITYQLYDRAKLKNDLALMEVAEPFSFNRYVRPICLPSEQTAGLNFVQKPEPGTICTAVGWGATIEHGADPDNLREVEVPIMGRCKHRADEEGNAICAGLMEGGKDACQGDSGGPLMCRNPNVPLQWYLAGIVSHGEGCARPNEPGVYTRVSLFLDWIFATTNSKRFPTRRPLRHCPGYICKNTQHCISSKKRCDKVVDCLYADDEIHCERNTFNDIIKDAMRHILLGSPTPNSFTAREAATTLSTTLLESLATSTPATFTESKLSDVTKETTNTIDIIRSTTESTLFTLLSTTLVDSTTTESLETSYSTSMSVMTTMSDSNKFTESISTKVPYPSLPSFNSSIENQTKVHIDLHIPNFSCKKILEVIDQDKRCNGVADCQDATDEHACDCFDYLKHNHSKNICDGIRDCRDATDEVCDICFFGQYHCYKSKGCIPQEKVCNFKNDCPLDEDEEDCFTLSIINGVELDIYEKPVKRKEGFLAGKVKGVWSFLCYDDQARAAAIASVVCSYLGFVDYSRYKILNDTSIARSSENYFCTQIYIKCLDLVDILITKDTISNDKIVDQLPWNVEIYADGIYHCNGILLSSNWVIASSNCNIANRLDQHYIVAYMGNVRSYLEVLLGTEVITQVIQNVPIPQTDIVLLRLEKPAPFTRYIQPLLFGVKDYNLNIQETCAVVGRHLNKLTILLLQSITSCKDGYRCFKRLAPKIPTCKNGTPWNGPIACHSRNGWYIAAIFHEPQGYCGFGNITTFQSVQFWKTDIEMAMKGTNVTIQPPKCEGMRCINGKCISPSQICDEVPDCIDQLDENENFCAKHRLSCKINNTCLCSKSQLRCANGNCVPKTNFCNTKNDCGDWSDEPESCTCKSYLALTNPSKVCDGVRNCFDKSDEDPTICNCTDKHYQCKGSVSCIPKDYLCDGFNDCPEGDDEATCLSLVLMKNWPKEVYVQTGGVWHPGCFPYNNTILELEEICAKMGYLTGSVRKFYMPNTFGLTPIMDPFIGLGINEVDDKRVVIAMRSGEKPFITLKSNETCHRLFLECLH